MYILCKTKQSLDACLSVGKCKTSPANATSVCAALPSPAQPKPCMSDGVREWRKGVASRVARDETTVCCTYIRKTSENFSPAARQSFLSLAFLMRQTHLARHEAWGTRAPLDYVRERVYFSVFVPPSPIYPRSFVSWCLLSLAGWLGPSVSLYPSYPYLNISDVGAFAS